MVGFCFYVVVAEGKTNSSIYVRVDLRMTFYIFTFKISVSDINVNHFRINIFYVELFKNFLIQYFLFPFRTIFFITHFTNFTPTIRRVVYYNISMISLPLYSL